MDAKIISISEPSDITTGAIWIKPYPVWGAFVRLGTSWIPLATSNATPIDFDMTTILISGEKTTIKKDSLVITDTITKEIDTCTFIIEDTAGTNKPAVGEEVLIFWKENITDTPELIFGGKIVEIPQSLIGIIDGTQVYYYEVVVNDYSQDLLKNNKNDTYEDELAGDIIKDIVRDSAKEIGTLFVEDGINIDYLRVNYKYPLQAIEEIAGLIGYDWYVDQNKQLHFFASDTNTAPYTLTDSLSDAEYKDLVIKVDKTQIKNKQIVQGGYEVSNLYTQLKEADGQQTSFALDYEPQSPITVYINTGGGFSDPSSLGIDNIDSSGYDFVVNVAEQVIKNLDHITLSAGHIIKITYKYKIPIFAQVKDTESIISMKEREGGDGVYEGEVIVDESINSKDQAISRGYQEIYNYSNPIVEGSFTTLQHGYRSGQLLTINIPSRGEDDTYLIRQVTKTSLGMGRFIYEVSFATKLKGLAEFLIELYDRGAKKFTRTDETLATYEVIETEYIELSDSGLSESRRNTTTSPYKWSNDEGSTEGKGQYNLASYG